MSSKLASLHAGLVIRNGDVVAGVSQPVFSYGEPPQPVRQPARRESDGWGEGGVTPFARIEAAEVTPAERLTRAFAHEVARRPAEPVRPVIQHKPARRDDAEDHSGPYRLTFRMTKDQRRRLRIAAAKQDMSLQKLLSDALDAHLDGLCACSLRDCTCLAREDEG